MNTTRRFLRLVVFAIPGLAFSTSLSAHRMWIVPSSTVLSGKDRWITVDAAISNDLFFPNHHAMPLSAISVTGPDGGAVEMHHASSGEIRSTFDVHLTQEGTYKIAQVRDMYFARWTENGERQRWRGSAEELKAAGFTDKEAFKAGHRIMRVEAMVTVGGPTTEVLEPTGRGLELVPTTHPNDLYAGETAIFALLLNGEPHASATVTVIKGDDRYRNAVNAIEVTTDAEGTFEITWPEPGRYWLRAEAEGESVKGEFDFPVGSRASYTAVFEVLPF